MVQGDLGLLTIATIFVVVLSLMYGGVRYSEGRLLPDDGRTPTEDRLHDALVGALNERRAAHGLEPVGTGTWTQDAQRTADQLLRRNAFADRANVTGAPPGVTLPYALSRCTQIPVKVTVTDPDWRSSNGSIRQAAVEAVADEIVSRLTTGESSAVVYRPPYFNSRVGVAIGNDTVYAVYRSCEAITD